MTGASCSRHLQKHKCALLAIFVITGLAQASDDWHILIEPKFLRYESSWPIQGSDRTVMVAARLVDGEIVPFTKADEEKRGATTEKILGDGARAATEVLAGLKPEYMRDDNKVIQYAVLRSESPLTASAVLAPQFAETFVRTLGPELLVAIPNRHTVYVFPKQSVIYQTFSDTIYAEYQSSPHPVSRELFELRKGKLIAIGTYR
jgi:hypothetical protein